MARVLTATSGDFLEAGSAVLTGTPLTMACFFQVVAASSGTQILMGLVTDGSINHEFLLYHIATPAIAAETRTTGASFAVSTDGILSGVWGHACGVWESATSRAALFNGANKGTNATSRIPSGINRTLLGARPGSPKSLYLNGRLAECGIWNAALDDAEVLSLSKGACPLLVRPTSLVAYWPLIGNFSPEIDVRGRNELTVTGAVAGAHPRIFNPSSPSVGKAAAAGVTDFLYPKIVMSY